MEMTKSPEPRRSKLIHLSKSSIETLTKYAFNKGTTFKQYVEFLIEDIAEKIKKQENKAGK